MAKVANAVLAMERVVSEAHATAKVRRNKARVTAKVRRSKAHVTAKVRRSKAHVTANSVVMPGPARVRGKRASRGSRWWWNQEEKL